ncbi:MAG: hypothetical protein HN341_01700 [Verrucomicrobia bacterium]|jgi:Fe-S-cluster containining protein|nr:hypothetical protein [Verrucomicrobiota bacterium]
MPPDGFECKQCGHCCLELEAFSTCASENDILRWDEEGRFDILEWVDPVDFGDHCEFDIWINPRTGDDVSRCPWLRKARGEDRYTCRIHDLKPDLCRNYPLSRQHAEETGCPGFVEEPNTS